ncbi:MAG: extracellular solute-binding protein [Thermoclostridium sp.]|nr:extracellular solute-binding protein [Thermoclostridium sp.]
MGPVSCKNPADHTTAAPQETQEQQKVTLRFISSWGGVDSRADALKALLDQFMLVNKNIEVINESLFGEDFLPKIKTDFASGNAPDVFGLWPGSDIRSLIRAGRVADLTDLMDQDPAWKNLFKSSMLEYTTYEGKIYGLPVETIFEALFINEDLFNKHSVKVPESFEELKDAIVAFRRAGIDPIAYNAFAEGTYLYQNMVALLAGKEIAENPAHPEFGKYYRKALEYMLELYNMGAFPKDAFTMTNRERNSLFQEKKAAMIVQGSWFIGYFDRNDQSVDIVYFPTFPDGIAPPKTIVYGLGNGCFHISSAAYNDPAKQKEAVKLLRFLTARESAAALAQQTGMLSSVDVRESRIDYNQLTRKGQMLINNARQFVGPPDSFVDRTAWEEVIADGMPYVLEGKWEIDELWEKAIRAGLN